MIDAEAQGRNSGEVPRPAPRLLGERGLSESMTRLNDRIVNGLGRTDHLIPFAEVLAWLYSLHEWHRKEFVGRGLDFFDVVADSLEGEVLSAVIFARGVFAHSLADTTHLVGARPFRLGLSPLGCDDVLGGQGVSVSWGSRDTWPGRYSGEGADPKHRRHLLYDRLVAGQPLTKPLQQARDFLVALA